MNLDEGIRVVSVLCGCLGICPETIYARSRNRAVAEARQKVMFVLWRLGFSYRDIGALLGRDHQTARAGCWRMGMKISLRRDNFVEEINCLLATASKELVALREKRAVK